MKTKPKQRSIADLFAIKCPTCQGNLTVTWRSGWQCKKCNPQAFEAEKDFVVGRDNWTGD